MPILRVVSNAFLQIANMRPMPPVRPILGVFLAN